MQRKIKRTKVEKRSIDEEAMNNAFNKVWFNLTLILTPSNEFYRMLLKFFKQDENEEDDIRLDNYVDRYFKDPNNAEKLQVLFSTSLSDACRRIAEYHDDDAANQIIEYVNWERWTLLFSFSSITNHISSYMQ